MDNDVAVGLTGQEMRAEAGDLSVTKLYEELMKDWRFLIPVAILTLGSPLLGLVPELSGWPGVIVGLMINTLCFVLGVYAIGRVLRIESQVRVR